MKNESVGIAADRPTELAVRLYRSRVLIAIGFGLCCAAGLLLTAGKELNQAAYVDPYIYAGYIHDYPALLARFGTTYYSERIAFIYPERLLTHLFGLEGGYFAFRFAALAAAIAAVFAVGLRFYGYAPAILAAVWLAFTPWLPRSLFWTYPDGAAVVYLLVGAAFLLVPIQRRLIWHVVAGAAFALAVDCNLFLLLICGLVGPGWAFFYRREGINWLARAILALAVGFFATYLALALLFYLRFPAYGFSFELRSIQEAITELGGKQKIWYAPLSSAIWEDHDFKLLIPVTLLLATFAVIARRSATVRAPTDCTDFGVFAVIYLASIICLFLLFHFGLHGFVLTDYAYTVFALPSCVLALIVLGGEAERRGGRIFGMPALYGGSALILLWWLAYPILPHLQIASSFYFWVAVAVATVTAAIASRRIAVTAMVLIGGTALLSLCLYQTSYYQIRTASPDEETTQWDIYHGGIFLQQFVNANIQPSQALGFWYTGDHDSYLNSVQSMYLWLYTRVFPENSTGMPLVDEQFRNRIARGMPPVSLPIRALILLGLSDAETDVGLDALKAAGLPFGDVTIARTHFQGQLWGYTAVLIEMNPPTKTIGPLLRDVPVANLNDRDKLALSLASFRPVNGATISLLADALRLTTSNPQWSYSLTGKLQPELVSVHGSIVVRVRLQVAEGKVGVAVSTIGSISKFIREVGVDAAPEMREVDLEIPDASAADLLILRNQSPSGRSRAVVYSVDLLRPK
jgi:hypothetical protein